MKTEPKPIEVHTESRTPNLEEVTRHPGTIKVIDSQLNFAFWNGKEWTPYGITIKAHLDENSIKVESGIKERQERMCWKGLVALLTKGAIEYETENGQWATMKILAIAGAPLSQAEMEK